MVMSHRTLSENNWFIRIAAGSFVIGLFVSLDGCNSALKQQEAVAKDWCFSIRANQMIPVYPLTEDLVPGDVFLVQRTIGDQQDDWNKKGFLPLDDHRCRIKGVIYSDMYFDGYWKDDFGVVPHARPGPRTNAGPITTPTTDSSATLTDIDAPRTAFPTYTFQVTRGGGLSLAVPIHGVPIGLNYLNADEAVGSVMLLDTHTYAADSSDLEADLHAWASSTSVKQSLADAVAMSPSKAVYLRVVTRVYLVGGVAVTLNNTSSSGGDLTAGNAPTITSITPSTQASDNYTALLNALSNTANGTTGSAASAPLAANLPKVGGSVQFTQASSLGVSLNETFDRPLVIGYLGFDVAVNNDGQLGPRVPTFGVLQGHVIPSTSVVVQRYVQPNADAQVIRAWFLADPTHKAALNAWLAAHNEKDLGVVLWLNGGKTDEYTQAIKDLSIK
jgi:hypothetical protein